MTTSIIRKPAAAMNVVEAAHTQSITLEAWAKRIVDAAGSLLSVPGLTMAIVERQPERYRHVLLAGKAVAGHDDPGEVPVVVMDYLYRFRQVAVVSELVSHMPEPFKTHWRGFMASLGVREGGGIMGYVGRLCFALYGFSPHALHISSKERALLRQVAAHVESGLSLRAGQTREVAILRPSGSIEHAEVVASDARSRARLSSHVRGVEAARTRRGRAKPDSLDTWTALVQGRWGLVERVDRDGQRFYVIVENAGRDSRFRALSAHEAQVLELSARGASGKNVAYALGVSSPLVSQALSSAALKVGCTRRTELVRVASLLLGSTRDPKAEAAFTQAEREVLRLVRGGFSNAEIAAERKTSERTVSNQIAALLKKAQVPSRRALATLA